MWKGTVWYINCDQGMDGDNPRQQSRKEFKFSKAGRMKGSAMKSSKRVAKSVDLNSFSL